MSKRPNPYGPEVEPDAEGAPSIPLWIGGRAFLTMPAGGFFDLRGKDGRVRRRVPLCDGAVIEAAVGSALESTSAAPQDGWSAVWSRWADGLRRYSNHVAGLLSDEASESLDGSSEVDGVVTELAGLSEPPAGARGVVAVIATNEQPFAAPASLVLQSLAAGQGVILKTSVRCPSGLLAFAELATRAGVPDGRFNVVHGDDPVVAALCAHPQITAICCAPGGPVADAIAKMAEQAGKRC